MYDLIIRNARLIDAQTNMNRIYDIAISDKKIAEINTLITDHGEQEINAENCILTPGLIDYHLHIFNRASAHCVDPGTSMLPNGVTSGVDGGTSGSCNYELFHRTIAENAIPKIFAAINISETGLCSFHVNENIDPQYFDEKHLTELTEKYKQEIVGIKLRMSKDIVLELGEAPLVRAIEIADKLKLPMIVHVTNPAIPIERLADLLRPGDVFCHMYMGKGETILDENQKIRPQILNARKRGVIFDACNGKGNYAFDVSVPAIEQGFYPDILSTDIGPLTNYRHPVISLPFLMSKYLNMGLDLEKVVDMVTNAPAKQIGHPELGTLAVGTPADLAVFQLKNKEVTFFDYTGRALKGNKVLVPQMTVLDGTVVYRQTDF